MKSGLFPDESGLQGLACGAKNDPSWRYYELDASHSAHVTAPEALARLLQTIVSERA